jgi:hypothetical protein
MPPVGNPSLSDWPQLLNSEKLEANMYRLIDNELVILPNILDINKKGAFKDLDLEDK